MKGISMNNIRASTWRSTAVALFVILTTGVCRAEVSDAPKTVSETSKVLGLTIAVDQTTWTTHQPMLVHVTVENRSNKPFQITTHGGFMVPEQTVPAPRPSRLPFEMFDINFELTQIKDGERRRIALVRPVAPNLGPFRKEWETVFPGDSHAMHTLINFAHWKPAHPDALVNGSYELQASWTGNAVQDDKPIDVRTTSNVLRIEIGD
jgi:hypothetical protein